MRAKVRARDRCPSVESHPLAHAAHRLARERAALVGARRQRVVHAAPARSRSAAARARIGTSSLSIDSASTFLQSMQPHPAVLHCTATCSTVAGGLNALCR